MYRFFRYLYMHLVALAVAFIVILPKSGRIITYIDFERNTARLAFLTLPLSSCSLKHLDAHEHNQCTASGDIVELQSSDQRQRQVCYYLVYANHCQRIHMLFF